VTYDSGHFTIVSPHGVSFAPTVTTNVRGNAILLGACGDNDDVVVTHASARFLEMTGYVLERLQGLPLASLFTPIGSEATLRELRVQLENTTIARSRCRLITNSGKAIAVELEMTQLYGDEKGHSPLHIVVRDAYERQTMSHQIAGLLSSFEAIQSEVRMGTWIVDATDGWRLRCSPEVLTIYDLSAEQAESNPEAFTNRVHPDDRARVDTTLSTAVYERQELELEYRIILSDRSLRWLKVRTVPLEDPLLTSYRMVGVVFDITNRVLTDASLRDAEQRYRAAAEVGRDALLFFRAIRDDSNSIVDFEFADVNHRACELLMKSRTELVGKTLSARFPLSKSEGYLACFTEVVTTRIAHERTTHNHTDQIQCEWMQLQAVPLGDGLTVSIRDVSAEKRLERQLARAQRLESVGRMATGIAHDFNNMLSAINGFTTIARDGLSHDSAAKDDLTQALIAANRASQLTRYLLTFASRQPITPDLVQVNVVLSTLTQILSRILGHDIQLELKLDPKVVGAWLDSSQLEQAIINLATNARDAMPQGGTLRIETRVVLAAPVEATDASPLPNGEYLSITVSDTGTGMDAKTRDQVFEPFFTTKGPTKGTGLGLATLYGFVKQSGGGVTLESALGKGTCFCIYLPHRTLARKPDTIAPPCLSGYVTHGHETLLLVDCDESVRRVARRILELHGYHVLEAANAGEAYFALEEPNHVIDLLLMSPHLPRINAIDFVTRAKRSHPNLAVVAMSGAVAQEILEAFVERTQAQFIPKPLTPERLVQAVAQSLNRRSTRKVDATLESRAQPPSDKRRLRDA
jgi:PAS domain S-box-containing protein